MNQSFVIALVFLALLYVLSREQFTPKDKQLWMQTFTEIYGSSRIKNSMRTYETVEEMCIAIVRMFENVTVSRINMLKAPSGRLVVIVEANVDRNGNKPYKHYFHAPMNHKTAVIHISNLIDRTNMGSLTPNIFINGFMLEAPTLAYPGDCFSDPSTGQYRVSS